MKSGNVCVPLDFSIEQKNLNFISKTAESEIIFCDKKIASKLDLKNFKTIISEDQFEMIIENQEIVLAESTFDVHCLAEIIFTSGSTGKPKGVMITHQNIISNTDSIIDYLKLTSKDIQLIVLPFYYCYGLSLLHTYLRVGGQVVLNNTFMFLGTVITDLRTYKCTGFSGVPSHYQMLLKKSKSFKTTSFPDLRYVTQAGGKLHNVFIKEFVEAFPDINFIVMYGQTEATARLSYLPHELVLSKLGSIGKEIPDVIIKIVNKQGDEAPIDEVGEIVAKGENIMSGYYNDSKRTKEVVKNGWLYTGDVGKKDKDGFVYITARKKEIVKVGGKRVSPKEIEEVILSVTNVDNCTVIRVYSEILGEALKAIIVTKDSTDKHLLKVEVLKKCKEKLSLFKIPQIIEVTDRFNIKPSGKKII